MKRILLTGGGTGGHVYPLIAVAECLTDADIRYFGPKDEWSAELAHVNIPISKITKAKLRRYFSLWNLVDGPKFLWSIFEALIKVALFRPQVAFSKGGPTALPVLFACHLYGIPIIIHESDAVAGLTSRVTGKWAAIVEIAWEEARGFFPNKDVRRVGVPLRRIFTEPALNAHNAKLSMECDLYTPVLLVIGGSQGSERMNNFVMENIEELCKRFQIIHQTGSANYENNRQLWETARQALSPELQKRYHPYAYLENKMASAYGAADCALSRSGSVIFELSAFGIPSVLVPLPEAAHDHQRVNAYAYAKTGAAIVVEEDNLGGMLVISQLEKTLQAETRKAMSAAARAFTPLDAAEKIAQDILAI